MPNIPQTDQVGRVVNSTGDNALLMQWFLHDINNLFTCIICSVSAARSCGADLNEQSNWLESVRIATIKAMELTSLMIRMCDIGSVMDKEACNVKSIIIKAVEIFRGKAEIAMDLNHISQPCIIFANETAIVGVLINILMGAAEASPDDQETISMRYDITEYNLLKDVKEKCRCVGISIDAMGDGIKEMSIEKLFGRTHDTPGNNHQLGLEMVRRIVEHHGGTINVASKTGSGSSISLLFPLMERNA